jgi:putative membrane protein
MIRLALALAAGTLFSATAFAQSAVPTAEFVKSRDQRHSRDSVQRVRRPKADEDTKPFAEKMIKDHSETLKELKALVQSGKVKAELPTSLDAEHQKKLDDLKKLSGKPLDSAYDKMQVEAHREAVDLFTKHSQTGDNADLKQWAGRRIGRCTVGRCPSGEIRRPTPDFPEQG